MCVCGPLSGVYLLGEMEALDYNAKAILMTLCPSTPQFIALGKTAAYVYGPVQW